MRSARRNVFHFTALVTEHFDQVAAHMWTEHEAPRWLRKNDQYEKCGVIHRLLANTKQAFDAELFCTAIVPLTLGKKQNGGTTLSVLERSKPPIRTLSLDFLQTPSTSLRWITIFSGEIKVSYYFCEQKNWEETFASSQIQVNGIDRTNRLEVQPLRPRDLCAKRKDHGRRPNHRHTYND